ncbi:hypothetical protein DEO72_LG5g2616 [Vigna unguiculata]|uniref:Uncharacterized protein n=1 Tax=Vigna unguiculata TaxID=3917 RepID=A0A4D6M078_VIGUN|nr:hypothetical protein DEO72_LG5g2616 [Vigna unguiculata]
MTGPMSGSVKGMMEPPMKLFEEAIKSWYDEQMMMSTVTVHGFSFYAKHISDVGYKFGYENEVSSLTSQVNEMKAMVTFFVQNYQGELPQDFPMFHTSPVSDQRSVPNEETNDSDQDQE